MVFKDKALLQHKECFKGELKPCTIKTKKHGTYSFKNEGTQILNILKDIPTYHQTNNKKSFIKKLKAGFIEMYS